MGNETVYIDVRDYGAVCNANYFDSVTTKWYADSSFKTVATDDYNAIVAAINASKGLNAKRVLISGRCLTSQPIQLYEDLTITGLTSGVNQWCSIVTNTDIEKILYYEPAIEGSSHNIIIENLRFFGYHATYGIKFNGGGEGFKIYNCGFFYFTNGAGIYAYAAHASTYMELIVAHHNKDGILISGNGLVTIIHVSGDGNNSLVHFKNCDIGICGTVIGMKSEQNQYPFMIESCNGGQFYLTNATFNVKYANGDQYCIYAKNSNIPTIILDQIHIAKLAGITPFVVDSTTIIPPSPYYSYTAIAHFVYGDMAISANYSPKKSGYVGSLDGAGKTFKEFLPNINVGYYTSTAYLYNTTSPSMAVLRNLTADAAVFLPNNGGNMPSNLLIIANKDKTYKATVIFNGGTTTIEGNTQYVISPGHTIMVLFDTTNNNWIIMTNSLNN